MSELVEITITAQRGDALNIARRLADGGVIRIPHSCGGPELVLRCERHNPSVEGYEQAPRWEEAV
jgi:hypothetical protein